MLQQESAQQESLIIGRQHDEEVMRREVVEARMNRWYNRLLNRHQDDPVSSYSRIVSQYHCWCTIADIVL